MKINRHILVLTLSITMLLACKKEQANLAEFNKNCSYAKEVSADFLMEEITNLHPIFAKYTNTDIIFKNKNVRFTALEKDADYTWYIGTDVINEKTVSRYFSDAWVGQDLPITLVVRKKPNTICLPNDDGVDSTTKILHVSQFPIDTQYVSIDLGSLEGDYRVKSPHLIDSFDISFDVNYDGLGIQTFNIYNYDGEGSDCANQAIVNGGNYRQIWASGGTGVLACDYLIGNIHNRIDGVTEMTFTFGAAKSSNPNYYERIYLGRKL